MSLTAQAHLNEATERIGLTCGQMSWLIEHGWRVQADIGSVGYTVPFKIENKAIVRTILQLRVFELLAGVPIGDPS